MLGTKISGEQTSRPPGALPAETDSTDGVTSLAPFTTATTNYSVNVSITNTTGTNATVAGWIDWNRNGVFDTLTERAFGTTAVNATSATLTWPGISGVVAGATWMRVRIYQGTVSNPLPTG